MPLPCPVRNVACYFVRFVLLMCVSMLTHAQPALCSSDGQPTPTALLERVINADCDTCWVDSQSPHASNHELVLDWIVPGALGDSAPLSIAASRDSAARLLQRGLAHPDRVSHTRAVVVGLPGITVRVAHGVAVGGYVGASIRLTLEKGVNLKLPLQVWVALVEALPTGTEGSPVDRNLVRNVLQPLWDMHDPLSIANGVNLWELRPMNLGEGVQPQRVRLAAWLEDAQGQVLTAALSHCPPEDRQ